VAETTKSIPPRTTAAAEDYLERISELIRRKGYARVVDIAAELKISQASVTTMVQRLDAEGLVKYEKYRGMVLDQRRRRGGATDRAPARITDDFSPATRAV